MMQAFVEKGGEPTAAHLIRRLLTMDTRQKALDEVLEVAKADAKQYTLQRKDCRLRQARVR
jgi:hypothetical protein